MMPMMMSAGFSLFKDDRNAQILSLYRVHITTISREEEDILTISANFCHRIYFHGDFACFSKRLFPFILLLASLFHAFLDFITMRHD